MDKIKINGGIRLNGEVEISGMKNAALPIIFACVLIKDKCKIENIPNVRDVQVSFDILRSMGAYVNAISNSTYEIDCTNIQCGTAPIELTEKLRASYYLLGSEVGRFGRSHVSFPGGCDFGSRPIDQHIKGFSILGGSVLTEGGYIDITTHNGLKPGNVYFDKVSVGATINIMLAATLGFGLTVIENAAKEPHIVDLANFLNSCGARISGAGTDNIRIYGVSELHGCEYAIIPDMIEAGTYMIAAAATKGNVLIKNIIPKHVESISAKLIEIGAEIFTYDDAIRVVGSDAIENTIVQTRPYPGFPTDMHPQISTILSIANGTSTIIEGVYENRFRYVDELRKFGANLIVSGRCLTIFGVSTLTGAPVKAVDLRAGISMVLAGLIAKGITEISDVSIIERGYSDFVDKFTKLGARIEIIN